MKLIGISGKIGAGKDTVHLLLQELLEEQGLKTTKISFAKPLKDALATWCNWDRERLEHDFDYKEGYTLDDGSPDFICQSLDMTRRQIMQKFGTDAVRKGLHPDFWVILSELAFMTGVYDQYDVGFITDCRFLNELNVIKRNNGTLVQVKRTGNESTLSKETQHISELEWCQWKDWDSIITNDINPDLSKKENLARFKTTLIDKVLVPNFTQFKKVA